MNQHSSNPQNLPDEAPELWPGKLNTQETLPDFFGRVWEAYLPLGLDASLLKKLDKKLLTAIRNYPANEGKPWPEKYRVPNRMSMLADAEEKFNSGKATLLSPRELAAVARKLLRDNNQTDKPSRGRTRPQKTDKREELG